MNLRWVCIVGIPRSGTSFLTGRIHEAGIPMWVDKPGTEHNECPAMRDGYDAAVRGDVSKAVEWKKRAEERGQFPCGFKHPWMVRQPAVILHLFPPDESLYIICRRDWKAAAASFIELTKLPLEQALRFYSSDLMGIAAWLPFESSVFWFNYDGDIESQQLQLSERLGRNIDLVNHWKPK